jgi:tripartite-type tricarboxylate transporter receptor subunit TctC
MVEGRLTRGAPFLLSRTRPRPSPRGSLLTGPQRHAPPITADSRLDACCTQRPSLRSTRTDEVVSAKTMSTHGARSDRPIAGWRCARLLRRLAVVGTFGVSLMSPAAADSVSDFFGGKTLSLITGFPPGGGYDSYIRVLARHYGKFVPGHPSVIPSNMPGAGSLTSANYIYGKAVTDGTVLAMFASSAVMEPMLGNKSAAFDPVKFSWIGSMSQQVTYCGVWQSPTAAKSFDEMMTKRTIFGAGAPAATTFQHPTILKNVLGADIQVIPGYPGSRELNLAMHRGEVDGVCSIDASSIRSQWPDDVRSGQLKLVIQMGNKKSDEFGDIPSVFDYAKTDEQRAVFEVLFKQLLLGRPLAGPPGIPPDRLRALRAALTATMQDSEFLADAAKVGLEIDPASVEEVEALLKRYAAYPPEIFRKAEAAIGR